MTKRCLLRILPALLSVPAWVGAIHAQSLSPAASPGQLQDRPAIRQDTTLVAAAASTVFLSSSAHGGSIAGGVVQGGLLLRMAAPSYPLTAKQVQASVVVTVEAIIGKDGRVTRTSVLRGPYALRWIAEASVKQWRFEPTLLNGKPVERVAQVDLNFVLGRY